MAIRVAMMPITTSNSTSVNPRVRFVFFTALLLVLAAIPLPGHAPMDGSALLTVSRPDPRDFLINDF